MTIYRTPYATSQCEGFAPGVSKTQVQLKAAAATGALNYIAPNLVVVEDGDNYRNAIPSFTHPMLLDPKQSEEKEARPTLAMDARPFGQWSRNQEAFIVRNESEMNMAKLRLRLSSIWLGEERNYLRNVSAIPVKMFTSWISEGLQRKFALEPIDQMRLSILAGILYNSNFSDATDLDETDKVRAAGSLGRDLGIDVKEILTVMDKYPVLPSIDAFCRAAGDVVGVRLQELNRGVLYASLGGSWFGYNFKEILAVALEHPPTWLAIVYTAGSDRSYRNTGLMRLFERVSRGGADQLFYGSIKKLVENFAPLNESLSE